MRVFCFFFSPEAGNAGSRNSAHLSENQDQPSFPGSEQESSPTYFTASRPAVCKIIPSLKETSSRQQYIPKRHKNNSGRDSNICEQDLITIRPSNCPPFSTCSLTQASHVRAVQKEKMQSQRHRAGKASQ